MSKQKKQSFLYGSTILMASMIIVKIIGAVFKIPLTNVLHESGMGYFNSAYTIYTAVYALTVTGFSAAVARMVAENCSRGRYRDVKHILKLATRVFVIMGSLGFLIIAFSAKSFAAGIDSANSYWTVVMIAPAILFCCLMASYRGYYEGLSDMKPTAITQVVEVVVKLITGLAFAYIVMGIADRQFASTGMVFGIAVDGAEAATTAAIPFAAAGAMLGVSVSTFIGFLYIFISYKLKGDYITEKMLAEAPPRMRSKVLLFRLIKISIPITLGAVVLQLSALIDMFTIMNRLTHAYEIAPEILVEKYGIYLTQNENMHEFLYGSFTSVITLFNLVPAFTSIFGKSALPNVTAAFTEHNRAKLKVSIESVVRVTTLVASPMAFGIAFMSGPILRLLYRNLEGAINVGTPLLVILGIAALFLAMVAPLNAIFQGIGRMDLPVKFLFAGALVKIILNFTLIGIPSINIMGGAISTIICYGLIAALSLYTLKNKVNVTLNFNGILVKPVVCGLICGFSAFLCNFVLTKLATNSIITIVSIGFGGVCYIISLGVFNAISRDDVLMLPKGNKILKTLEKLRIIR